MYLCFPFKELDNNDRINNEIIRAIKEKKFVYFDSKSGQFFDENDCFVDLKNKIVLPSTGILELEQIIKALISCEAIIPNNLDQINIIYQWYKYIEPKRLIVPFTGAMVKDLSFLTYLFETFSTSSQVFLKTCKKDFNGIVDLADFFDENSDLRKAFLYHENDEFILSEKVEINQDEIGFKEYRIFVYDGRIMNISRITDTVYHKIPCEVLEYAKEIISDLPLDFPKSFVLDIFEYDKTLDVLEFNPFESSGKYLYNTIFEFSDDLLHDNIENVPDEKVRIELSYINKENLVPSTTKALNNSFAKDYNDIKLFGDRFYGFVHISGAGNFKIDLNELLSSCDLIQSDNDLSLALKNNSDI